MGGICSSCKSETVFYPVKEKDKTTTVLTTDGSIRVYSRSRRNSTINKS